jgi:hypothetical protein
VLSFPKPQGLGKARAARSVVFPEARSAWAMPPGASLRALCRGAYTICVRAITRLGRDRVSVAATLLDGKVSNLARRHRDGTEQDAQLSGGFLNVRLVRHRDLALQDAALTRGFLTPIRQRWKDGAEHDAHLKDGRAVIAVLTELFDPGDELDFEVTLADGEYYPLVLRVLSADGATMDARLLSGEDYPIVMRIRAADGAALDARLRSGEDNNMFGEEGIQSVTERMSLTSELASGTYE